MTQNKIISWYLNNKRDLPWRLTRNPYFIWISEIILQQTRVAQGLPYYETFTTEYPSIHDLANASEEEVLRHWQGLGYYSRGRNLHFTAKHIVNELNGEFPSSFNEIIKLKGVGNYTAAAIASFAFKEKVAAVDGNVIRVISRLFKIDKPADSPATLKEISSIANELIETVEPDLFNQAMMELGALVCTPKSPSCDICPVQPECLSFPEKAYERIPFKEKKTKVLDRTLAYIVLTKPGYILLRQRDDSDIWKNMYDFPEATLLDAEPHLKDHITKVYPEITHLLSHRKLSIRFSLISTDFTPSDTNLKWYTFEEAEKLPKPKVIVDFISNLIHS